MTKTTEKLDSLFKPNGKKERSVSIHGGRGKSYKSYMHDSFSPQPLLYHHIMNASYFKYINIFQNSKYFDN